MAYVSCHSLKRTFRVGGRVTSLALEPPFWRILDLMARERGAGTLPNLLNDLHRQCRAEGTKNFSSCLRIACLRYVAQMAGLREHECMSS